MIVKIVEVLAWSFKMRNKIVLSVNGNINYNKIDWNKQPLKLKSRMK